MILTPTQASTQLSLPASTLISQLPQNLFKLRLQSLQQPQRQSILNKIATNSQTLISQDIDALAK